MDIKRADNAYQTFPPFSQWSECQVDHQRWSRYGEELETLARADLDTQRKALRVVRRAAAVETGAIEGLYEVDRGFTMTVAQEAAVWEAAVAAKGDAVRRLISAQLEAYEYVLDFATGVAELVEAWIRKLHSVVCAGQEEYQVYTEVGPQKQPLPKGKYKHLPNHVRQEDGSVHPYAPVDLTPAEMHRFVAGLKTESFQEAHPVLQASYAHYGLVVIHPFADGNGRVARALGSVFTYRATRIPLMVLAEDREEYFTSLSAADDGDHQAFVDFVMDRCLDTIQLVRESFRAAALPSVDSSLEGLSRLYVTKGGFTQDDVDKASQGLMEVLHEEVKKKVDGMEDEGVTVVARLRSHKYDPTRDNYRVFLTGNGTSLDVMMTSRAPAEARVRREYRIEIPKDCGRYDDLVIREIQTERVTTARIGELLPFPKGHLRLRMAILAEELVRDLAMQLKEEAENVLDAGGYRSLERE